jgi:FkbM family methyltransferase
MLTAVRKWFAERIKSHSPAVRQSLVRCFFALWFLYAFGPVYGAWILIQLLVRRSAIPIAVPGLAHPVHVRPHTTDVDTFLEVFVRREYDLAGSKRASRGARKHTIASIVDGGANVGYTSLFFTRAYPDAHIIAVEPDASNFALLVRNTQPYPNITPLHGALWPHAGSLRISNPQAEHWAFQVQEADTADPGSIRAFTIPDLLALTENTHIDLLKLDIEGAEKELFTSGAASWLPHVDLIAIELHDFLDAGCAAAFYRALAPYEFSQFTLGENTIVDLTSLKPVG